MRNEMVREKSTVVVADDASIMRETLREILTMELDYRVVGEASDGLEVIERVKQLRPDVVALDIVMPGQSGIAALRSILDVCPSTRVVMCCSLGQGELVAEAIHEGAQGFVVKPFSPDRTLRTFNRVTNRLPVGAPEPPVVAQRHIGTTLLGAAASAWRRLGARHAPASTLRHAA